MGAPLVFALNKRGRLCDPWCMTSQPPSSLSASAAAHAHWTIYLPSIVVALVWAGIYLWAVSHQPVLGGLRAVALVVEALGVPLLLFFAAVRARVLAVEVRMRDNGQVELYARSGFARPKEIHIGAQEIAAVHVRRSLPQKFFGGGALVLKTLSGDSLWFTDLDQPDAIAQALTRPVNDKFGTVEKLR